MNMKTSILGAAVAMSICSTACAQQQNEAGSTTDNNESKILVVYFSHTGENYAVGDISEGNTAIIAKMIADETGADIFEVKPVKPYPKAYTPCTEVAQEEKYANARPEIIGEFDTDGYDTIYIGYPIWWGDAPMPLYTFIDRHVWEGKTVIPFCTHEGSGLCGTSEIAAACKGATLGKGLAVKGTIAQNERDRARKIVKDWLGK